MMRLAETIVLQPFICQAMTLDLQLVPASTTIDLQRAHTTTTGAAKESLSPLLLPIPAAQEGYCKLKPHHYNLTNILGVQQCPEVNIQPTRTQH
jgi:hypothetical protein